MLILLLLGVLICLTIGIVALVRVYSLSAELDQLKRRASLLLSRLHVAEDKIKEIALAAERDHTSHPEESGVNTNKESPALSESIKATAVPQSLALAPHSTVTGASLAPNVFASSDEEPCPIDVGDTPLAAAGNYRQVNDARKIQPSFEAIVGKRWMTWIGAVILFFSAAFFLKYAFDNELIGPTGQVVLCALAGIAVLIGGTFLVRRNMQALGQGLMGLGLAILYVTFAAAASSIYEPPVLAQMPAFLLLVAVTVSGMTLAVLHNAPPIAILAVLGGLATPLLVSTGQNSRGELFTYLLMLDLGVLGIAFFRNWRVLDAIAIVGSYVIYCGWHEKYYDRTQLGPAIFWLAVFYLVLLSLPFIYHLVKKTSVTLERFILAQINAIFTFGYLWLMLKDEHRSVLGFVALGMAAIYLGVGVLFRRVLPGDTRTLFGAITLAVVFLTMAIPLNLHADGITLAWAVEGPVLLYLGYRFRYQPVRIFGVVALLLSLIRMFYAHWPLHHEPYAPFINHDFISAAIVPLAIGIFALIHHRFRNSAQDSDREFKLIFAYGGGILALVLVQYEICGWIFAGYGRYLAGCIAAVVWLFGSLLYLFAGRKTDTKATWAVGCGVLFVSFIHLCATLGISRAVGSLPFVNARFLTAFAIILCVCLYAVIMGAAARRAARAFSVAARICWGLGIFLLLGLFSYEVPTYVRQCLGWTNNAAQLSLTVTWGVYAAALLATGFAGRIRVLRYCGLGLFGISALKLLVIDIRHIDELLRIVSYVVIGVLMLAASYFYHRLETWLSSEQGGNDTDNFTALCEGSAPESDHKECGSLPE